MKNAKILKQDIDMGGNAGEIRLIPITSLKPSPLNSYNTDNYEDLKASIKGIGLLTPLTVLSPNDRNEYTILSGGRRFNALTSLHNEEPDNEKYINIPCYISESHDVSKAKQKIIIETANLEARDEDDYNKDEHILELLNALVEFSNENDESLDIVNIVSETFGKSKRYGRYWKRIMNSGTDKVKKLISLNEMNTLQISRIAGESVEKQDEIVEEILSSRIDTSKIEDKEEKKKAEKANKKKERAIIEKHIPKKADSNKEDDIEEDFDNEEILTKPVGDGNRLSLDDIDEDLLDDLESELGESPREIKLSNKAISSFQAVPSNDLLFKSKFLSWASKAMKSNKPSSEEWEIINKCKEIAEHFSY